MHGQEREIVCNTAHYRRTAAPSVQPRDTAADSAWGLGWKARRALQASALLWLQPGWRTSERWWLGLPHRLLTCPAARPTLQWPACLPQRRLRRPSGRRRVRQSGGASGTQRHRLLPSERQTGVACICQECLRMQPTCTQREALLQASLRRRPLLEGAPQGARSLMQHLKLDTSTRQWWLVRAAVPGARSPRLSVSPWLDPRLLRGRRHCRRPCQSPMRLLARLRPERTRQTTLQAPWRLRSPRSRRR